MSDAQQSGDVPSSSEPPGATTTTTTKAAPPQKDAEVPNASTASATAPRKSQSLENVFYGFRHSYAALYFRSRRHIDVCTDKLSDKERNAIVSTKSDRSVPFKAVMQTYLARSKREFQQHLRDEVTKGNIEVHEIHEEDLVKGSAADVFALGHFCGNDALTLLTNKTRAGDVFLSTALPKPYDTLEDALGVAPEDSRHLPGSFTIKHLLRCLSGSFLTTTNFTVSSVIVDISSPILTLILPDGRKVETERVIRIKETGAICIVLDLIAVINAVRKAFSDADGLGRFGQDVLFANLPEWIELYPAQK